MNKLKQKRQHVYDYCIRIQEERKESKIFTKRRMKIEKKYMNIYPLGNF